MHNPVRGLRFYSEGETRKEVTKTEGYYVYYKDRLDPCLDLTCGYGAFTLGYNNKELSKRILDNYDVSFLRGVAQETTAQEEELIDIILDKGDWDGVSWAVSGSDAVEAAMAMVDGYWKNQEGKERKKVIVLFPCYVGTTMWCKHVRGAYEYWDRVIQVKAPQWIEYKDQAKEEEKTLASIRKVLEEDKAKQNQEIGSLLMESSPWLDDMIPWSENFWREIRKICDEYGVLWVLDDVAICWGKFGTWYGWQNFNVQPDVSSIAKGLTGGYSPMGAAVCNKKVFDVLNSKSFDHGHTYHPNMWGVTAAIQTTKLIEEKNLLVSVPDNNKIVRNMAKNLGLTARGDYTFICLDLTKRLNPQDFWNYGFTTGLPIQSTQSPGQIKVVIPLMADDNYFSVLYDRMEKMCKDWKMGIFSTL